MQIFYIDYGCWIIIFCKNGRWDSFPSFLVLFGLSHLAQVFAMKLCSLVSSIKYGISMLKLWMSINYSTFHFAQPVFFDYSVKYFIVQKALHQQNYENAWQALETAWYCLWVLIIAFDHLLCFWGQKSQKPSLRCLRTSSVSLLLITVPIMYRYTVPVVNQEPIDYPAFWCNGLEWNSQACLHNQQVRACRMGFNYNWWQVPRYALGVILWVHWI